MTKLICILMFPFMFYEGEMPVPPKSSELLFYIQRNHNRNTIVYEANFDNSGMLIEDNPVNISWIRYEEQGQRMELRAVEKWYAYGVNSHKIENSENTFIVQLVSYKKLDLVLVQNAPFKVTVSTIINNNYCKLDHFYIYADNSGYWPKVKYIEMYGNDTVASNNIYEKLIISE